MRKAGAPRRAEIRGAVSESTAARSRRESSAPPAAGPRCEVAITDDPSWQVVCPASCPCTIERQRAMRELSRAVARYILNRNSK